MAEEDHGASGVEESVECETLYGEKTWVPKKDLQFRPVAYAIVIEDDDILVVESHHTHKKYFPGGGMKPGENAEDCVVREVKEETGVTVEVVKFFTYCEQYFHHDERMKSYHNLIIVFVCRVTGGEIMDTDEWRDTDTEPETEKPRWVPVSSLQEVNCQPLFWKIFQQYLDSLVQC